MNQTLKKQKGKLQLKVAKKNSKITLTPTTVTRNSNKDGNNKHKIMDLNVLHEISPQFCPNTIQYFTPSTKNPKSPSIIWLGYVLRLRKVWGAGDDEFIGCSMV